MGTKAIFQPTCSETAAGCRERRGYMLPGLLASSKFCRSGTGHCSEAAAPLPKQPAVFLPRVMKRVTAGSTAGAGSPTAMQRKDVAIQGGGQAIVVPDQQVVCPITTVARCALPLQGGLVSGSGTAPGGQEGTWLHHSREADCPQQSISFLLPGSF